MNAYDEKCKELAQYFLVGEKKTRTEKDVAELAQEIQNAIEEWLERN